MHWPKAVSVPVLRVQGLLGTARPTQPVGPVSQGLTTQTGSLHSVLHTNHQRLPARLPRSLSNGHAPLTSTEQKPGSKTLSALLELLRQARGSKSRIPARQRLQLAKPALNHSSSPAPSTPAAQSSEQEPASVLTHTDNPSGSLGRSRTLVSLTLQPAKPQRKAGRRAASKTKAASKSSRARAPVQILTDSRFSVCGR